MCPPLLFCHQQCFLVLFVDDSFVWCHKNADARVLYREGNGENGTHGRGQGAARPREARTRGCSDTPNPPPLFVWCCFLYLLLCVDYCSLNAVFLLVFNVVSNFSLSQNGGIFPVPYEYILAPLAVETTPSTVLRGAKVSYHNTKYTVGIFNTEVQYSCNAWVRSNELIYYTADQGRRAQRSPGAQAWGVQTHESCLQP